MQASLKYSNPLDLLALAAIGGDRVLSAVESELDRRAGRALIRRVLATGKPTGRRRAARQSARAVRAAAAPRVCAAPSRPGDWGQSDAHTVRPCSLLVRMQLGDRDR